MTKKSIVFLSIFLATAVLIAGGVLWYSGEVKNQIALQEKEIWQIKFTKPAEELVWYNIPELGIRFKVTKKMADDLIYNVDETSGVSESYGEYYFLYVALRSHYLDRVTSCPEQLGSIMKFNGSPDQYDGTMWRSIDQEVSLGNMHLYNGYFIIGQFSYEVEVPHNCYVKTDYYSIWDSKSRDLMNAFRKTVEPLPSDTTIEN